MALPTKLVTWVTPYPSINHRIVYSSVVQVMQDVIFKIKQDLKANGYTVKGSSDGTAGGMDALDRWATAADAGTRADSSTTPISWIVLTDGNGYDICFSYNSSADHIYRISVSFAGNYVAAGTPTHQPTSADEQLLNTFFTTAPGTIVASTASLDRLLNVWVRTDAKGFRVWIVRDGSTTSAWGVEPFAQVGYAGGVTVSLSHGFYINGAYNQTSSTTFPAEPVNGNSATSQWREIVRTSIGTKLASCGRTFEILGAVTGAATATQNSGHDITPELQGGTEYVMTRVGIWSNTTTTRGKVGNLLDWWIGRAGTTGFAVGDTYGNREFIHIFGIGGSVVWDWDGTPSVPGTVPILA